LTIRIRVIDAFADRPFEGNPAAVCLLEGPDWPSEAWMRKVAMEMNLSETAFARRPSPRSGSDWKLRWFTPVVEDDLCGHATLATAHVLFADGLAEGEIRFETRSGILFARATPEGAITLDFPTAKIDRCAAPGGLAAALGGQPECAFSTGLRDLLVVFDGERRVRELRPDFAALAAITRQHALRGVIATAGAEHPEAGYDFVSRFFSPADGIPEDAVTGSTHTALVPLWSDRLGRRQLVGIQASARTGRLYVELRADRVWITGRAVTVLDGTLLVPTEDMNGNA